jgi:hypothetical protein
LRRCRQPRRFILGLSFLLAAEPFTLSFLDAVPCRVAIAGFVELLLASLKIFLCCSRLADVIIAVSVSGLRFCV